MRVDNLRLLVKDFAACFRFYTEIMGFEVALRTTEDVYAELKCGDFMLGLYRRDFMAHAVGTADLPVESAVQDRFALVFAVDDVDAVSERWQQLGVAMVAPAQDRPEWGLRTAHFRDPDGNLIELFSRLPD